MSTSPFIEFSSGKFFSAFANKPYEVTVDEIAHSLSNLCRFVGHCRTFYSVAEHSVLVSEIMEIEKLGDPLEGLWHDRGEAVTNDVAGPWKPCIAGLKAFERQTEGLLKLPFDLPAEKTPGCERADLTALVLEARVLMPSRGESLFIGDRPLPEMYREFADRIAVRRDKCIFCLTPAGARTSFLHRHEKLMKRRK